MRTIRFVALITLVAAALLMGSSRMYKPACGDEKCVIGSQSVGRGDDLIVKLTNKCGQTAHVKIWIKCNGKKLDVDPACMAPGATIQRIGRCFGPWKFYWDYDLVPSGKSCEP